MFAGRLNRTIPLFFMAFSLLLYDFFRPQHIGSSMEGQIPGIRIRGSSKSICRVLEGNRMPTIFDKQLISAVWPPTTQRPERPTSDWTAPRLNISVVFTSVNATLEALRAAGALASRLHARITLVVPEVVPYQLPLDKPPILHDWNGRRFQVLASKSSVETVVRFYLCRDRDEALASVLKPHSLVVIGGKRRWWWTTAEGRLAGRLRKLGHEVILAETE
jgi:hypothetical protein